MKKFRIASDVKAQIISRIKNDGVSVAQAAKDAGRKWCQVPFYAKMPQWEEHHASISEEKFIM